MKQGKRVHLKSSFEEFIWRVHLKSFYLKSFYLKSFYLKSFLFEEFNNVNGGMDVVGSWSVGSSSMRWRIGTSDTVVKALPSVRVRIWRVRIWRVRIWRVRIWRVHLKSSFEEFIWRVHLRVIGCLWVCFKNRKSSDACQWCDEREFIWTRVHLNESSFGQTGKKKTETRNETGQKSSSEEFIWRVHLKSSFEEFLFEEFLFEEFLFEEFFIWRVQ